ncbi:MAG: hypothetical protein RL758_692 [Pseudomonadota bacterium]|jgi:membrane-bound lytic murein transglycosylase D
MEKRFLNTLRMIPVLALLLASMATHAEFDHASPEARSTPATGNIAPKEPDAEPSAPAALPQPPTVETPAALTLRPPSAEMGMPDLWTRIRKGFVMPDLEDHRVREQEQWYASRPDYILRMTERSRKYLFHIVEEIERRNMPMELALLPFIESAFNPQAVSTANAAGMWQFIPSTGKHFSLRQTAFNDERRDVLASTRAALDYLQRLHDMFGDWHLALAAYNWGEGSVQRAIRKNQSRGLGIKYTDLSMPNETRYYVPKLQAVKNLVLRPDSFSAPLPSIADHPYFQSVTLQRDIDVSLAAKLSEVDLDVFRALNPAAKKPLLLAAATPQILLPWDNAAIFESNLQSYDKQLASWTAWQAPRNMKLAEAAKSVGMSESDLRSVNQIPPRMMVKAGSVLLVHRAARHADQDVPEHVAENGQTLLVPEASAGRKVSVKARKGETIASMAKRLRIPASQLAQWNQLDVNTALKLGQPLVIYVQGKAGVKKPAGPTARKSPPSRSKKR